MNTIDLNTPVSTIQLLLEKKGWLVNESITQVEKAGEGNMNMVMKVTTDQRTFILKQSRPYVYKYPQIPAPEERILTEYQFQEALKSTALSKRIPEVLHFDPDEYLMMSAFIEGFEDMIFIYEGRSISDSAFEQLMNSLNQIHVGQPATYPLNTELRGLNHQHIFELPFLEDNGFSLDEVQNGLEALSRPFKGDAALKERVDHLAQLYLAGGDTLLHGDYYPGSWMQTEDQVYIIDAEFSHMGFREFDLGVMVGHLIMATSDETYLSKVLKGYAHKKQEGLVQQMAGVEIVRRLIGLGQLPLERSLEEKQALLTMARHLILD